MRKQHNSKIKMPLTSGESLYYLGRTKDYLFIYNVSYKITSVIKGDGVQENKTWKTYALN